MSMRDDNLGRALASLAKSEEDLRTARAQTGNALAIVRLLLATTTDEHERERLVLLRLRLDNEIACLTGCKESTRETKQMMENEFCPLLTASSHLRLVQ